MEWFDYSESDMRDPKKAKEVFRRMIEILEKRGDCRTVFHRLAWVLFSDGMEG